MGQTSYPLSPVLGVPGQIEDVNTATIVSGVSEVALAAGLLVCVDPTTGLLTLPAYSSGLPTVWGIVAYSPVKQPNGVQGSLTGEYESGQAVPVVRRGRVFAQFSGGTQVGQAAINVMCSSTVATSRGILTMTATSTTSGSEIQAVPSTIQLQPTTVSGLVLVDVNFP